MADMKDNSQAVLNALDKATRAALTAIGIKAVEYATADGIPVDTGLLRNSITYALDGGAPAKGEYKANSGDASGAYQGVAPAASKPTVYIGTNVEYAPHVELGTVKMAARPFISPAINDHGDEYKQIAKDILSKA